MDTGSPRLAQHLSNTYQSDLNNTSNNNQVQEIYLPIFVFITGLK